MSKIENDDLLRAVRSLGRELGRTASLISDPGSSSALYAGFRSSAQRVRERYLKLTRGVLRRKHVTHETESIFDSFFVVEAAIFEIRNNLKREDVARLPLVALDDGTRVPRLYQMLSRLLESTDRVVDKDIITEFLSVYQEQSPLSTRELYSIPTVLQILLIEQFGRLVERAIVSLEEYGEARAVSERIMREVRSRKSPDFSRIISNLASSYGIIPLSFGFYLFQRLSPEASSIRPVLKWLKLNLEKQGVDPHGLAEVESRERSRNSLIASHTVESLHWLNQTRWERVVETVNMIDVILSKDPAGAYSSMETESKALYRRAIVKMAESAGIHEAEIAREAVRLAQQAEMRLRKGASAPEVLPSVETHVGFYIIDKGMGDLRQKTGYKPTFGDRARKTLLDYPSHFYFGAVILGELVCAGLVWVIFGSVLPNLAVRLAFSVFAAFLNLEAVLALVNTLVVRFVRVSRLPELDVSQGVSESQRTFVVIPTMMRSAESIRETVRKLEVRYLGNREENVLFALLFDFKDADSEALPGDAALVEEAREQIEVLNRRYVGRERVFYALHRKRVWNESEGVYMGWERKRGKLREFNALVRGGSSTTYVNGGDLSGIGHVRYVITLDEDTEMPKDAARRLIGCMHHPINRPVLSRKGDRIVRGYGIIQPRVGVRLGVAAMSAYSRLYSAGSGVDSYSTAVSDVYQDLFGSALFFGKGIYDIDAVEATMGDKIPDNLVLSHDLLEGIYARTGYASSVVFFDGFPRFYHEFAVRLHRWIRGDWQIIGWLRGSRGFSFVDRFKIFDNLRRSLVPVAVCAVPVFGIAFPGATVMLVAYSLVILSAPSVVSFASDLLSIKRVPVAMRLRDLVRRFFVALAHVLLRLVFVVHQAFLSLSAVCRTLIRLFVTRRHLLEWQISTDVGFKFAGRVGEFYRVMLVTQVVPALYFLYVLRSGTGSSSLIILCLVSLVSPLVAFFISRSASPSRRQSLTARDIGDLRAIAYRTARYFIDLPRAESNWLIQDHLQDSPRVTREDRLTTSPTNLGMLFGSLFSAHELGYLTPDAFIDRSRKALDSVLRLERYKGHLYNWYDIQSLAPLSPSYMSSVDSANFILALIAYRQGVRGLSSTPLLRGASIVGLRDAVRVLSEEVDVVLRKGNEEKSAKGLLREMASAIDRLQDLMSYLRAPVTVSDFYSFFTTVHSSIVGIERLASLLRADESMRNASQVCALVDTMAKDIEAELAFQRYMFSYAHSIDSSIGAHVSKDQALARAYESLGTEIDRVPSFDSLSGASLERVEKTGFPRLVAESSLSEASRAYVLAWYESMIRGFRRSSVRASSFKGDLLIIDAQCSKLIDEPEFGFLYNEEKGLFHIGYNATYNKIDSQCYNFLASEANSVSFVAILKNQAPLKHWFYLGRKLVRSGNLVSLVSWGGSLFEYLTSLIYFDVHEDSLLGKTARSAISVHRRHGASKGTPWGMGESAHYLFDTDKRYQYQVFGSPHLGLKRGLVDYTVIAPYVSALALSFLPRVAVRNMRRISKIGGSGTFGFFDAIDYTGQGGAQLSRPLPTRIWYAHHQGFSLLGIHNAISSNRVRNLFHSDSRVVALETLFEEKVPATPTATSLSVSLRVPFEVSQSVSNDGSESRRYIPAKTPYPHLALLGNGTYSVSLSNVGAGYSRYGDVSLTRYRDEPILEESGQFFYVRNERTGALWSPTLRPLGGDSRMHKIVFHENKAEFEATHGSIGARIEATVHPEYPVEIRSVSLSNEGSSVESLTVTSYGEVSLALQSQETHHPLFQRIMVTSKFIDDLDALVYSRPHPSDRTKVVYFAHMLVRGNHKRKGLVPCANRESFFGRDGGLKNPAFLGNKSLVAEPIRTYTLDPIFSLSQPITIKQGHSVRLTFVNAAHENYDELLKILHRFKSGKEALSALSKALPASAESTRSLGINQEMAGAFQALASRVLGGRVYDVSSAPASREPYVNSLWKLGISGDYPIIVLVIRDIEDIQSVKHAVLCHSYWRHKGIHIDMVILNQEPSSYIKSLDDEIDFLLRQSRATRDSAPGSRVYHVKSDLIDSVDGAVLSHVARVVINSADGSFKQQAGMVGKFQKTGLYPDRLVPAVARITPYSSQKKGQPVQGLDFANSFGGFDKQASEYVINVTPQSQPPSPWSNMITSPSFGTAVDHRGSMFTWSVNSYDNRISSWNNDPLSFRSSEIFYLRDEETGECWNPTPFPIKSPHPFVVRHGKGYTVFEHARGDLMVSLRISVSLDSPVKTVRMEVRNKGNRDRRLSETVFIEPVVGSVRDHSRDFISFDRDLSTGGLLFRNSYRNQLAGRVAFIDLNAGTFSVSTDKAEFIGRYGSYEAPAGMRRTGLSNVLTSGTANCIVAQSAFSVPAGGKVEMTFVMGETHDHESARRLIESHRDPGIVASASAASGEFWKSLSGSVRIETPDSALDALFNEQLLHQSLSSRVWGRTGMQQPSGAFGFRDQLQDMSAFIWSRPADVRAFLLKAASHQFREGDALNWWHDYSGFGVRSVLSDHQLWLVYATLEYAMVTGDASIWDEEAPFLEGPQLSFSYQRDWAGVPVESGERGSVYEHCVRALAKSSVFGVHGLPLMGHSDWNDGLSNAGIKGKGESVWTAWFLGYLMKRFSLVASQRGDVERSRSYVESAASLSKAVDRHAWDGKWYRRAFLDSGTIIGSKRLNEFKIDSVSQSWAVLSGLARPERRDKALDSMFERLCDDSNMRLLAPAMGESAFDPGYVRDYPPGVRENGSQYNHAALWAAQAFFVAGRADEGKKILDLVNPFLRSDSAEKAARYRVEPYVVASDVYAAPSYAGRGGWTWYTGSAGVMYKTVLQFMLGFRVEGDSLSFAPALPTEWGSCSVTYRKGLTSYEITYQKPVGSKGLVVLRVSENGVTVEGGRVALRDDGLGHAIVVELA